MTEATTPDLALTLPLSGIQLVEASAGTGKTHALATLVTRLVVEQGLAVTQILAVTFTEAATRELRARIRQRLELAARLAAGEPACPDADGHAPTLALVEAARANESTPALAARLRRAAEAMDLAPVFTIHGFCRRALSEHALEAGRAVGETELLENERELRERIATDLWRDLGRDPLPARALRDEWNSPAELADGLRELLAYDELLPAAPELDDAAEQAALAAREAAGKAVATAYAAHGAETLALYDAAFATGGINKTTHGERSTLPARSALLLWALGGGLGLPGDMRVGLFSTSRLANAVTVKFVGKVLPPRTPLTDALDDWRQTHEAVLAFEPVRRLALLHRLHREGGMRMAALKRERRQQGFDDLVRDLDAALRDGRGEALAARLRAQYAVALLDEFQDTDPRQWAIFRRLFAESGQPLFLIGDPKQAIYRFRGGDVGTYQAAASHATGYDTLKRNFRSRPILLRALQALYEMAGERAFGESGICFEPVEPGGKVADPDLRRGGAIAAGLHIASWHSDGDVPANAPALLARATTSLVAQVRDLLAPGRWQRKDEDAWRDLRPGDLAVLVETHRQAEQAQRALVAAGVSCVAAGKQSVYATAEAHELWCLFEALLHPADDGRLRAALATPLLGLDAAAIAALDGDDARHRHWQDQAMAWRQRWDRHGPLALVAALAAEAAPRLLAASDGERRLSNTLQLAEALQAARALAPDPRSQRDELQRCIQRADADVDAEQLRLESDAACVQVVTLHKSKGLEFPVVLLPYLAAGTGGSRRTPRVLREPEHDSVRGRLGLKGDVDWDIAVQRAKQDERDEKLRVLYVGLTRAKLATFVGWGPGRDVHRTPFAALLHGARDSKLEAADIAASMDALQATSDAIEVTAAALVLPNAAVTPAAPATVAVPAAVAPRRLLSRDWWVHSFSGLAREAGGTEERGARDESEPAPSFARTHFAGARFGNVLHEALENVDAGRWRGWRGGLPPEGEAPALENALRAGGYASSADREEGLPLLTRLVANTLNVRLPEGLRLADLAASAQRREMEFHFALRTTDIRQLLALLHGHGLVQGRSAFGLRQALEGLVTGYIDLVYEHEGRCYLLDYKSNQLPDYGAASLATAMAESEYDLQYLLYSLALHRWLRFRRPGYDYDLHFGGVRYLFCRGLEADALERDSSEPDSPERDSSKSDPLGRKASPGVFATRPPRALIDALDRLMAAPAQELA